MAKTSTPTTKNKIADLTINTIRFLAVDAVEQANSGHPGMPMGMAPGAYVLWNQFLKHNPKNPKWPDRDRFILSAGHGSMLLYALLHLTGYDLSLDDIKNFRQWGSKTPGHPEYGMTPGIETTTGPLGMGISTAVGMAMAQKYLNRLFPSKSRPLFDHKIYGIAGDGCLMEGIASEAASLAGHLNLNSIIFFYDDNNVSIDGNTDLAFTEDVGKRFEAYNWNVLHVEDGTDLKSIEKALSGAQKEKKRPTLIITRTVIGHGSPNKGNTADAHGAPLGADEVKLTKENLGWPADPLFHVPAEVADHMQEAINKGEKLEKEWQERLDQWIAENPEKAPLWKRLKSGKLPSGWEKNIPDFEKDEKMATRSASGKVINALAPILPELIGGSADLTGSNNTLIKGEPDFSKEVAGRNIRYGVREHAMSATLNGIALSDMLIPFGGTFFIFSDYMKGGMRLSALQGKRVVYVLTHDSIGVGEDGPTHQPIEQLAQFRAMPNMISIRPADAVETAAAWKFAIEYTKGPVSLVLTRQKIPVLKKSVYPTAGNVEKGAYILSEAASGNPELVLIATGSEVSLALEAQKSLKNEGIEARVVSMPSWEIFEQQPKDYRDLVLPPALKARLAIEALSTFGWERYVGLEGDVIGMTTFGASAPGPVAAEKFGFTPDNIVKRAKSLLGK